MKILYLIAAILCAFHTTAQVTVTVNPTVVLKKLHGHENGINLNYLTDDSYTDSIHNITAALKKMGVKMLRYPGGEKSDNYLFSGYPWTTSSPRMASKDARSWPTSDSKFVDTDSEEKLCKENVLDFDEMVQMAREIEAEPLIVLAYDVMYMTYDSDVPAIKPTKAELIEHAVEWVRYSNIKKRYKVKYWMIGNESWGDPDYNGETTPAQYAKDVYEFATAMKAVDPSIKIIVNGEKSWWSTLLTSPAVKLIDILAFSNYPVWDYKGGYSYYKNNNVVLTGEVDAAIRAIDTYTTGADKERIKVLPSEYNAIDWSGSWENINDLGHAICNFQMFGDILVKPKVEALCSWNTRWVNVKEEPKKVYNSLDDNSNLNATGIAQEIWSQNLLNTMVSAVSNNVMIKTYASYDTLTGALNVLLINKDSLRQRVHVNLESFEAKYGGSKMAFTGISVKDLSPKYKWIEAIIGPESLYNVDLQPASITVLKLFSPYITLPLTLHSFEGESATNGIQLKWSISESKDLMNFEVERKVGSEKFKKIGRVSANKTETNYTFLDLHPQKSADYRLKVVYANGTFTYSKTISIKQKSDNTFLKILIAPNPVSDILNIHTSSKIDQKVEIIILNNQGNLIVKLKRDIDKGDGYLQIPGINTIPKGQYWLQVIDEHSTSSISFLKR